MPAGELIVAADTVVDLDGEALGKPADVAEARATLRRLAAAGIPSTRRSRCAGTRPAPTTRRPSRPAFASPSSTRRRSKPTRRAATGSTRPALTGSRASRRTLVERIEGDYFTVVGFPLAAFARALPKLGYVLRPREPAASGTVR